ncbi:MAG: DUF423 domain-containing protein [Chitinophagaceae bacterium]|jgi:uncharacterized membrane protein YgdD (TMEM256/DUF423 family)|nr:DUF423 domain-containing protein [Chitinophagaceae bacterium]
MHRYLIRIGAILGALSVMFSAFSAHFLQPIMSSKDFYSFQTAINMEFFHSIGLMILGILGKRYPTPYINWSGIMFIVGIVLFSGSIYLLTLAGSIFDTKISMVGLITPVGGLLLFAGWVMLLLGIPESKNDKS